MYIYIYLCIYIYIYICIYIYIYTIYEVNKDWEYLKNECSMHCYLMQNIFFI